MSHKLYDIVVVDHGEYRHFGEVLSFITPQRTYMVRMVPGHPGTLKEMPAHQLSTTGVKPKFVQWAVVEGPGAFPIDMLRRDECAPLNFDPETKVIDSAFGLTVLVVARATARPWATWSSDRWFSFGWQLYQPFRDTAFKPGEV